MNTINKYICSSCGAILSFEGNSIKRCSYCGSTEFIKETIDSSNIVDGIVPVRLSEQKARSYIKQVAFSKKVFKDSPNGPVKVANLKLSYVPIIIYTVGAEVYGAGSNQTEIKYTELLRCLIDGNQAIENCKINSIAPFDLTNVKEFNPSYLTSVTAHPLDSFGTYEEIKASVVEFVTKQARYREKLPYCNHKNVPTGEHSFINIEANVNKLDEMKVYVPVWHAQITCGSTTYEVLLNDTNFNNYIYRSDNNNTYNQKNENLILPMFVVAIMIFVFPIILAFLFPKTFETNSPGAIFLLILTFFNSFVYICASNIIFSDKSNLDKTIYEYNTEIVKCNILYDRKVDYLVREQKSKFYFDDVLYNENI